VNIRSLCGFTPLHMAATVNNATAIDALCRHGADMIAVTLYDNTERGNPG
jgi:ankyrin repeat protein